MPPGHDAIFEKLVASVRFGSVFFLLFFGGGGGGGGHRVGSEGAQQFKTAHSKGLKV